MKTNKLITAAAIALLMTASGCNKQVFGLAAQNQSFGSKAQFNTQVDILWVIDTSASMDVYQNQLAPQVGVLVNSMTQTGLDYQMAVTTMDFSATGEKGKFVAPAGQPLILTSSTPNLAAVLGQRIALGANGSPVERGLQGMQGALSAPLAATNGFNAGFMRPGAELVVVFLSNEDDQSVTADYAAFLDSVHPPFANGERSWMAQFIGVVESDPTCATSSWANGIYHEYGDKYIALANASGGISASICTSDLNQALTNVKARLLEVVTEYHLASTPDLATLVVTMNGVVVQQDATNGWTYDSTTNSVRFHGTSLPSIDSTISIAYSPTGIK